MQLLLEARADRVHARALPACCRGTGSTGAAGCAVQHEAERLGAREELEVRGHELRIHSAFHSGRPLRH
jgi:hypothetical protein